MIKRSTLLIETKQIGGDEMLEIVTTDSYNLQDALLQPSGFHFFSE